MARESPPLDDGIARVEVLSLLAVALRPPTDRESLRECLARLRERLGPLASAESLEALERLESHPGPEREYHRLFLGPSRPIAPPFESVYRERQAYGASTLEFVRELRDAGLEPVGSFRLPPDHLALQLEYLAFLEDHILEAGARGGAAAESFWMDSARAFRDKHLALWLPPFLSRLEGGAAESPYTCLVRLVVDVLGIPHAQAERKEGD